MNEVKDETPRDLPDITVSELCDTFFKSPHPSYERLLQEADDKYLDYAYDAPELKAALKVDALDLASELELTDPEEMSVILVDDFFERIPDEPEEPTDE